MLRTDFVSGRSQDRFRHRVVIHEHPYPSQLLGRSLVYPFQKLERINETVSHAEQARLETEAELKRKAEEPKPSQKRRKRVAGMRFSLAPTERPWSEYEPPAIVAEANRIRHEAETIRTLFATIVAPNSRDRRTLNKILTRLQHEMNCLPFEYVTHIASAQGSMPKK